MARTNTRTAPAQAPVPAAEFVSPESVEATEVETPATDASLGDGLSGEELDPWGGLDAYTGASFAPPKAPVSPMILTIVEGALADPDGVTVGISGWDPTRVKKFIKTVKDQKDMIGDRRFFIKYGTVKGTGAPALNVKVSKAPKQEVPAVPTV